MLNNVYPSAIPGVYPALGGDIIRQGLVAYYNPALQYHQGLRGQILYDYSGKSYHGQLGSTTGSDTNDPTWTGQGLSFDGNDFCIMPVPFDVNGDWTIYWVAKRDGTSSSSECVFSWGTLTATVPYLQVYKSTSDNWAAYITNDAGLGFNIVSVSASKTGFRMLCLKKSGTVCTLRDLATGEVATMSALSGTFTILVATLGAKRINTTSLYLTGEIASYLPYNRATSNAEDNRNYAALKSMLAPVGVVLP